MAQLTDLNVERRALRDFTEQAYLGYSMYVILDRALPFIGDGLKPVQRRILYAMSELNLGAAAKFKKSARTVGDVIGKYHPHGDGACYEAMVLMAQPFIYRYALIEGQGNWGSMDEPKSFAAMRYTEARLSPFASVLLSELAHGTVDWVANFDGTLMEPSRLPARLPIILLNGTTGIAVGMATDIPPHNLREVAAACIHLLDDPRATTADLLVHIKGPDFPTGAEIMVGNDELSQLYESGQGSFRARATYTSESDQLVITALPYQSSASKIMEQMALQMQDKKLPMVDDIRDESDHETPTRLVLILRSNRVDVPQLMNHLFATTDLERSYRLNMNVIGIDGRPRVKGLRVLLGEWLAFRVQTVRRRLQHRLEKVEQRLQVLGAYLIAFLNIDEVIHIIRTEDDPKAVLMRRFALANEQAEAILELKLRHLAKLEEERIRAEQNELAGERKSLAGILKSEKRLQTLVRHEITDDASRFGDDRRTRIVALASLPAIDTSTLIAVEPVTVVLSKKGWVRAAKGHDVDPRELSFRSGDEFQDAARGKSNQLAVFLDSTGRCYSVSGHQLPSARGLGEPLAGWLSPPDGATFVGTMIGQPEDYVLLATDAGYGFVTQLQNLYVKNKSGKTVLKVPVGAQVMVPAMVDDIATSRVVAVSNGGRLLAFPVADLPLLPKGKGMKVMQIQTAKLRERLEFVVALAVVDRNTAVRVIAGNRHLTLKPADLEHYAGGRGRRGMKLPRGLQRVERLEPDR